MHERLQARSPQSAQECCGGCRRVLPFPVSGSFGTVSGRRQKICTQSGETVASVVADSSAEAIRAIELLAVVLGVYGVDVDGLKASFRGPPSLVPPAPVEDEETGELGEATGVAQGKGSEGGGAVGGSTGGTFTDGAWPGGIGGGSGGHCGSWLLQGEIQ